MTFKQLRLGQWFDFINPDGYSSFYLRCVKTSARKYRDSTGQDHRVGSVTCQVYNVTETENG